jgi:hypothetical protein
MLSRIAPRRRMTAALFGKIPNEAGAALDLLVDPLDGVGRAV